MNPDDPRHRLALSQFDGDDLRLLDYLIGEKREEISSQELAIKSFIYARTINLKSSQTGAVEGQLKLDDVDTLLLEQMQLALKVKQSELEELQGQREALVKKKGKPDRVQ